MREPSFGCRDYSALAMRLDRAAADSELLGDLVKPRPTRRSQRVTDALFKLNVCTGPPEGFPALGAVRLGPGDPSAHPFHDHRTFELGKHAHHLKHRLAGRRRGVDA